MKKFFLKTKITKKLFSCALPLAAVSIAPVALSTSCSSETISNEKNKILNSEYFSKDIIDLSKNPYNTWSELNGVTTSYNEAWVKDFGIKVNDEFAYISTTTPTTKYEIMSNLLFKTLNWDKISQDFPNEDIQKIKENTIFTINNIISNINGGVVIDYYVSIYYYNGKRVSATYQNGLRKSGTLYLQGFKIYQPTNAEFNSFNVEINTNLNYESLIGLPDDFFTNEEYTMDNKIDMIYNFVRENWTKIFRILGLISTWDTTKSEDVFKNSLYQLISDSNTNTNSNSLKIAGIPVITENKLEFKVDYLDYGDGQLGNNIYTTSPNILVSILDDENSSLTVIIIGAILVAGGASLLLIWLLVLMPHKQRKSKEDLILEERTVLKASK